MYYLLTLLLLPQVINFLLALLPALILLNYFYKKDPRPEPKKTVTKAFLLGIAATFPALAVELLISWLTPRELPPLASAAIRAFLIAGLVEESCKLAVINRYIYPHPEFDEVNDGIVYTMAAGLGFAFFENILYSLGSNHSWSLLLIRGITSVPLHGLASGLMGYYIGRSKFSQKDLRNRGLFLAVFYHGLYDFFLFTGSTAALLVIPLLGFLYIHTRRKMRQAVDEDIREYRI